MKEKKVNEAEIVNLIFDIKYLKNPNVIEISKYKTIANFLSDIYKNIEDQEIKEYSFKNSENLKNFVGIVYICSLTNIYLCVESPPGYGKTTAAKAISKIRNLEKFYIQTFHSSTYSSDLFGTSTINHNQITFNKGPLTSALVEGKFFIADELNISPVSTILSLVPIVELIFYEKIIVPGMISFENDFVISSSFFLIVCQNNVGIIGRAELPTSLLRKVRKISYPKLSGPEIERICQDIDEFLVNDKIKMIGKEESGKIGQCMIEINEKKIFQDFWSLRDVSKIIKRLQYQKDKNNIFLNFKLQHNLLFYALSKFSLQDKKKYFNEICEILKNVLNLNEDDFNDLKETFNAETILLEKEEDNKVSFVLQKRNLSIILYEKEKKDNSNQIEEDRNKYRKIQALKNFLESLFQIKLTSFKEPILLIGPSCYKTFISEFVLENSTTVALNRETTVQQLLGTTIFFTNSKHKIFCLTQIYQILALTNLQEILKKCENWEKNEKEIKEILETKIKNNNTIIPEFKKNLIGNIKKKLFSKEKENRLIDLKMDFNPGLILKGIFTEKSIILKDISKVKTSVLERFNELFSDKNILTLSEDTTNTFTNEAEKELKNFQNFRIFATCKSNDEFLLSEAILSRFTLIAVENYDENEQKNVLMKNLEENFEFIKEIKPDLNLLEINLQEILNTIFIAKSLKNERNPKKNLKLVFFLYEHGKNEKNSENLNEKYDVYDFNDDEFPFEINENKIVSKRTNLKCDFKTKTEINEIFKHIFFTKKFSEICDLIHFSISTKVPLLLEGENGQGKKTAINLISELNGLKIIHKVLSKSTKSEELLMNMIITKDKIEYKKTDVLEALEDTNSEHLIIFDEINNASLPVLDLLTNIFLRKTVVLLDGNEINYGNANIVGIINRNNNESLLDKIPLKLKTKCIYHICHSPNANDLKNIITKLFNTLDFSENDKKNYVYNFLLNYENMNENDINEILFNDNNNNKINEFYLKSIKNEFEYFAEKFINCLEFVKKNSIEPIFNLIDIKKYIDFRKNLPKLDRLYLMLFIFVYRFARVEIQEKMKELLKINLSSDFNPSIDYDKDNAILLIYFGKNKNDFIEIETTNPKSINTQENIRTFELLTKSQKLGIIFLVCCIKSNRVPLIMGETASGKSFLLKAFSTLFGQELILYQITNNSGMSIISGQVLIKTEIDVEEKTKLQKKYKTIKSLIKEKKDILKEQEYNSILYKISQVLKTEKKNLVKEDKKNLKHAQNAFKDIVFPQRRLHHKTSAFISAAFRGDWVFFDGVESGHPMLFDTLSSLVSENPQLNILNSDKIVSLDKTNISAKFKFFLSFDPGKKSINKILFNSCARFSLCSLDSQKSDATVVVYNSLFEADVNVALWKKISAKLAACHLINVKNSEIFAEFLAGGSKFSARHLTFVGGDKKHNKNLNDSQKISNWIKTVFELYYFNSFDKNFDLNKIENEVFDEFSKNDFNDANNIIEKKMESEVKNVLEDLNKIQRANEENSFVFNFKSFVQKCFKIKLKDENVLKIINNIKDTLNLLNYQKNIKNNEILSNYFQITIVKNLFKNLLKQMKKIEIKTSNLQNFSLESKELLEKPELKPVLLKMKFLLFLLNDEKIFTENLNFKIFDRKIKHLIPIIKSFVRDQSKKGFKKFLKKCAENANNFKILEFIFPKHKFYNNKNYNLIILYINAICKLISNENKFSFEIDKNKFVFNKISQNGKIEVEFCLNKNESFILTKGTKIKIPSNDFQNNEIEFEEDFEDSETILKFINKFANKNNINNGIEEIYENFNKNRTRTEEKKNIFTSEFFFNSQKNTNIYSRIWPIIFSLNHKIYKFFLEFYFEKEKNLFIFAENKFNLKNETEIETNIQFLQNRNFYYNKNSFLWKNLTKNLSFENLNKDDINSKLIDIQKEISNLSRIENAENEPKILDNEKSILLEIQKQFQQKKFQIEFDEDYRKSENELNEIKSKLNILKVQQTFENWKNDLIKDINDCFNLSKEEMIKKSKIIKKNFDSLLTLNQEKKFKNNLEWKIQIKNQNHKEISLYEIILQYNNSLHIIKKIDSLKMENNQEKIIKISSDLNQKNKHDLKGLLKYILSFNNFQDFDFEFANSICRAALMWNLFKNQIKFEDLCDFFKNFEQKKNRIPNENEKNELIYIFNIANLYELNMNIFIPNFKETDLIRVFYSFEKNDKIFLGPAFENSEISNKEKLLKNLESFKKENIFFDSFKKIAGKLCLIFYNSFIDKSIDINNDLDIEKIKETIQYKCNSLPQISDKYKQLKSLIDIINLSIYFDDYKNYKKEKNFNKNLTFEDFECFKNFNINSIINNKHFPSFQYFLIKNYNNIENLLKILTKENVNKIFELSFETFVPFWTFILRLMSSTNCLCFENEKNPLEKKFSEIIKKKIIFSIKNNNNNNNNLNWMNLTSEIKFDEIFNKKINMFYIFLNKICGSFVDFSFFIREIIEPVLQEIYEKLFDYCLNDNFDDLLNVNFSEENLILNFVKNPKKFFKKIINKNLSEKLNVKLNEPNCLNFSKNFEEFFSLINKVQNELKEKVEKLEKNLKIKNENYVIEKFKENNNRDITENEKENLLKNLESQKIFFDKFSILEIEDLLKKTKELLKKITNSVKKITNKEIIDFAEFSETFTKIKKNFLQFDSIYKIEQEHCSPDFINYLETVKAKFNSFLNDFKSFEIKFQTLPKIDSENILSKNFSLPEFRNEIFLFDPQQINDKHEILSQPLLLQKNNKLLCNYNKIQFNSGPICPELFNNESYNLKIYSLVNEKLNVEILPEINENELKKCLKIKNSNENFFEIEFFLPPPNKSQKEKIYNLNRKIKFYTKSSQIEISIEIVFIVCPVQIFLTCDQHDLIYENAQFKLNTNKLLKDEKITFKIYNNYKNNNFDLKYVINSLEKNTNDEPEILIKNNEIVLTIKKNFDQIEILHCVVDFYLTENMKIPILIDSLVIQTYFDFYIYDFDTKNFVCDEAQIFLPNFEAKNEIELNFLVSTFEEANMNGTFEISEISEGISFDQNEIKMNLNSNENYFSVKLIVDLNKFYENQIASFEFQINHQTKKIKLFEKKTKINEINLNLLKKIENDKQTEINNLNQIKKNSILISPFSIWAKGIFLYKKCFSNGKIDLKLELNDEVKSFYLSEDGYLNKEKKYNNFLIIIQNNENWFATVDLEISKEKFKKILSENFDNFFNDFNKFFPNQNVNKNFESLFNKFIEKTNDLNQDKNFAMNLIKNYENNNNFDNNFYYAFNKKNYIFNNSQNLQNLIEIIKEKENELNNFNKNIKFLDIENIPDENDLEKFISKIKTEKIKIKSKKFLIQNNVPIKEKFLNDLNKIENENKNNKKNAQNKLEISEINFIEIPKIKTLNSLIKFYDECDLGTLIFPLYINKIKDSKDEEKKLNEYFSILSNAYNSLQNNSENLICEHTNQFKKSFEFMISKLKSVGFKSDAFEHIKTNKNFNQNENVFHLPQKGKFNVPFGHFYKNVKKENFNNENFNDENFNNENFNNEKYENEKEEEKINENLIKNDYDDYQNNKEIFFKNNDYLKNIINNNKQSKKNNNNQIQFPFVRLELPKEIQKIFFDFDLKNKPSNKKIVNKDKNVILKKEIPKKENFEEEFFGDLNNYNEIIEIQTIIENMKNPEKKNFLYKTDVNLTKNLINFNNDNYKEYLNEKNEKKPELLQNLIYLSKSLTKKIIKEFSLKNSLKKIPLKNLEINLIFDCSRIINIYHKYIYFIIIIALTNAFSNLEIEYLFSIVGDCHFKAIIKDFNEPHSIEIINRIFECITIERYRTNIASCAVVALDKFPKVKKNNKRVFYFFTNGLDDEYKLFDEWNREIFSDKKSSFSFLFFLPFDDKNNNIKFDLEFVCEQLKEFSEKCNFNENLFTFVIKNENDVFNDKKINENFINFFIEPLISNENEFNFDIEIFEEKFEIENKIEKKIENIKKEFEYEENNINEENEIFAKKEPFNFNHSNIEIHPETIKKINTNIGKIISFPIQNLSDFIKNTFKIPKEKINLQLLEIIFEPNLPTETILTDIGNQIDIYEFIKFCINPTPNPKIYRELGGGFIKNYGLTIVLDTSFSCLGGVSRDHTLNTIRYLLSALSYIDLPSLNLIISTPTHPVVLCSEKGTLDALSNQSQIWASLLFFLNENYERKNTNLASAIRTAFNITIARKKDLSDYLFVLTDGLFQKSEADKIYEEISLCYAKNILIIGIGVGYYPFGIENLFPFVVYSRQPNKIIEALTLSFSDSKTNNENFELNDPNFEELIEKKSKYFENFKKYEPQSSLIKYLKNIPIFLNSFSLYQGEIKNNNENGILHSVEGPMKIGMYKEGSFKNKKILIVMLYSAEMDPRENPYLSYRFIEKSQPGKYYCIKTALEYLKIQVDYAIDYETAIEKLTYNEDGYCEYYACLILSGQPFPELPRNSNKDLYTNNAQASLLGEFIKVVIKFWENGGGLGLFSDNAPFTFQTNLILEKIFNGGINFRVGGFHEGKKILKGVESKNLEEKGTFNRKVEIIDNIYERPLITHSLYEMYEGNTVSYIIENPNNEEKLYFGKNEDLKMITNPEKLKPFIPLSKDSDGGYNSLFYCSNGDEGDIIIDCSYTKFFLEMDTTGTPRYLMNICSWLAAIEKHKIKRDCIDAINFKPKFVDVKIDWDAKFDRFMERKNKVKNMKTLFVVDKSASVYNQEIYFNKVFHLLMTNFYPERGDAFYTWNEDKEKLELDDLKDFFEEMDGQKGTNSSLIADIAEEEKDNNFEHLIIITDGDVKKEEIDKSDKKFKEYGLHFSFVSCFIIDTGDIKSESVGCPYSRDCPGFTYIVDKNGNQKELASLFDEDIQIFNNLNEIKTYEDFILKYGNIHRIFRAKCLGKETDEELTKKFNEFKKNINVPEDKIEDFNKKIGEIEFMINGGLRNLEPIAC